MKCYRFSVYLLLCLCWGVYWGCTQLPIKIEPTAKEIMIDGKQKKIRLSADLQRENSNLIWDLSGPGKLDGDKRAFEIYYIPPSEIDQRSDQAKITLTISKDNKENKSFPIWFHLVGNEKDNKGEIAFPNSEFDNYSDQKQMVDLYIREFKSASPSDKMAPLKKITDISDKIWISYLHEKSDNSHADNTVSYQLLYKETTDKLLPILQDHLEKSLKRYNRLSASKETEILIPVVRQIITCLEQIEKLYKREVESEKEVEDMILKIEEEKKYYTDILERYKYQQDQFIKKDLILDKSLK